MMEQKRSGYSAEILEQILERIRGGETLLDISKDENMPCRSEMYLWRHQYPEFNAKLLIAEEVRLDSWLDEIKESSNIKPDEITLSGQFGDISHPAAVQARKLKVETLQWFAAATQPRKYGKNPAARFDLKSSDDSIKQFDSILNAAANAKITSAEAAQLASVVTSKIQVSEVDKLAQKVEALTSIIEHLTKGYSHGQEKVDSSSDKEQGSIAPSIGSAGRKNNSKSEDRKGNALKKSNTKKASSARKNTRKDA